jgi:hypothetical protein
MMFTVISLALVNWATCLFRFFFFAGWTLVKTFLWFLSPVWLIGTIAGIISGCLTIPAEAGWLWGPDAKSEAASQALKQAAEIANEAARIQAGQYSQFLAAVEALSNERIELARHLQRLGEMASRDSSWAAALQVLGPVLIAAAVLALGSAAIWLVTRSCDRDCQLADLLVDEISGHGRLSPPTTDRLEESLHGDATAGQASAPLADITPGNYRSMIYTDTQEMPF